MPITFNGFNHPLGLIIRIKDGSIDQKSKTKYEQIDQISQTTREKWEHKSEK